MAVVAISRQIAALGDEIASVAAERLGYKFISRNEMEERIVALGFPQEKLVKYDEKKPGFFAELVKDRDAYLQYLQTAVLEFAAENNCILIGRGSYLILEDVPSLLSFRLVSADKVRLRRLIAEFSCTEKEAQEKIDKNDADKRGFLKSFFSVNVDDPLHFHLVMNTGIVDAEEGAAIIESLVKATITTERDAAGIKKIETKLMAQRLVNRLVFEQKINIEFLSATIDGKTITLHGVADSSALVEHALTLTKKFMPGYDAKANVSIVQDFRTYR